MFATEFIENKLNTKEPLCPRKCTHRSFTVFKRNQAAIRKRGSFRIFKVSLQQWKWRNRFLARREMIAFLSYSFHVSFSNMSPPKSHIPYSNLLPKADFPDLRFLAHIENTWSCFGFSILLKPMVFNTAIALPLR